MKKISIIVAIAIGLIGSAYFIVRPYTDNASNRLEAQGPKKIYFTGDQKFEYSDMTSDIFGSGNMTVKYAVAVEDTLFRLDNRYFSPDNFANKVNAILQDKRSWVTLNRWNFQQVPITAKHSVTFYLVTPNTRKIMCLSKMDRYSSCRHGNSIVINAARWRFATKQYDYNQDLYHPEVINHEFGHFLGYKHQLCGGSGMPAPVMQQQIFGLHGCLANAWVFDNNGRLIQGRNGEYPTLTPFPRDPNSYFLDM